MLPKKEWNKITKALDAGTLKLRFLTDKEYEEIESRHKARAKEGQEHRKTQEPARLINA